MNQQGFRNNDIVRLYYYGHIRVGVVIATSQRTITIHELVNDEVHRNIQTVTRAIHIIGSGRIF